MNYVRAIEELEALPHGSIIEKAEKSEIDRLYPSVGVIDRHEFIEDPDDEYASVQVFWSGTDMHSVLSNVLHVREIERMLPLRVIRWGDDE